MGNVIRKEIGIAERKESKIASTYNKDKNIEEKVMITVFGFHERCSEENEDSYRWPGAPEPASKCPDVEGETVISLENVLKISNVNYNITIKYKYNENIFDFI